MITELLAIGTFIAMVMAIMIIVYRIAHHDGYEAGFDDGVYYTAEALLEGIAKRIDEEVE